MQLLQSSVYAFVFNLPSLAGMLYEILLKSNMLAKSPPEVTSWRASWRSERDSNPRVLMDRWFSGPEPSSARPSLRTQRRQGASRRMPRCDHLTRILLRTCKGSIYASFVARELHNRWSSASPHLCRDTLILFKGSPYAPLRRRKLSCQDAAGPHPRPKIDKRKLLCRLCLSRRVKNIYQMFEKGTLYATEQAHIG